MKMTVEEGLRLMAGIFILGSVALGVWVNPWWLAFTAFVGANLLQSAFTKWCPMMAILKRLGFSSACEPARPVASHPGAAKPVAQV